MTKRKHKRKTPIKKRKHVISEKYTRHLGGKYKRRTDMGRDIK